MPSGDVATVSGLVADSDLHVMEPPDLWQRLLYDIPLRKCAPNR